MRPHRPPPPRRPRLHPALLASPALWLAACQPTEDKPDDSVDDIYDETPDGGDDSGTPSTDTGSTAGLGLPDCTSAEGHATTIEWVAETTDGSLDLVVSHSGGCETREFSLCWPDGAFVEEVPVSARLELLHTGPPDLCEAWITTELTLDVTPMAEAWRAAYGSESGELDLHLHDWSVHYAF